MATAAEVKADLDAMATLADVSAEQVVLGILMDGTDRSDFWQRCCTEIRRNVTAADFFWTRHRAIYGAIQDMNSRGLPGEFAAIRALIPDEDRDYLASLIGIYPGCALGGYYAARVHDLAVKRRGVHALSQSVEVFFNPDLSAAEALSRSLDILAHATVGSQRSEGIFETSDVSDRVFELYEKGHQRGASSGWTEIDPLYRVRLGLWTLVTGMPSHGKSAWLDALLVNLAREQGWHFVVCSPENQPIEAHMAKLARLWTGLPFYKGSRDRMTEQQVVDALAWEYEHFTFVLPNENSRSITNVLGLMETVIERRNVHGIVLDPWNEFEHARPASMTETEYISDSLTRVRNFARRHNVHVWLVAHPTKLQRDQKTNKYPVPRPYDISGSAHWWNKGDNIVCVYREDDTERVQIHVQKVRFTEVDGERGVAALYYDKATGQYHEVPA